MSQIKHGIAAVVAAGAALATGQAAAEAYYLGGSIGGSNFEASEDYQYYDCVAEDCGYYQGEVEYEADDTAFKVFGGYMFNDYLGIEAGYMDLGDLEDSQFVEDGYYGYDGGEVSELEAQITGWTVQLVGQYPIGPVDVFAKAGFMEYDLTAEQTARDADCTDCYVSRWDWSEEGNDWIYGVGASWNVGDFGIRAEYEMIDVKNQAVDDLSVWSLGVEYHLMR